MYDFRRAVADSMVAQGYEAKGHMTKDVCYFVLDPQGNVTNELWFDWPFVGFMHDAALSELTWLSIRIGIELMRSFGIAPHYFIGQQQSDCAPNVSETESPSFSNYSLLLVIRSRRRIRPSWWSPMGVQP